MSNLSSFVLRNTVDTATVASSLCASVFLNGNLCFSVDNFPGLGKYCEGGHIICKAASTAWIVAPRCAQVSRTWYCRNDANTLANTCTSCTGWFVPTVSQLQNPGYTCRQYWDLFSCSSYWSSTELFSLTACSVNFGTGNASLTSKTSTFCVRAFRCVTY
jgi:hypothetical protein